LTAGGGVSIGGWSLFAILSSGSFPFPAIGAGIGRIKGWLYDCRWSIRRYPTGSQTVSHTLGLPTIGLFPVLFSLAGGSLVRALVWAEYLVLRRTRI
jgi:hypothetical protein